MLVEPSGGWSLFNRLESGDLRRRMFDFVYIDNTGVHSVVGLAKRWHVWIQCTRVVLVDEDEEVGLKSRGALKGSDCPSQREDERSVNQAYLECWYK